MDKDQYLNMINSQLDEARENMKITEKAHRESMAKYNSLLNFKQTYIQWVVNGEETKC